MQNDYGPFIVKSMLQGIWHAVFWLLGAWYMWAFVLLVVALRLGPQLYETWRLRKAGMPEIDRMTGLEFEKYLEILFTRLGYQVERTRYVGDQGGDLILTKGGARVLVQAKRHSKAIGNKAVQEAAAARPHYKCHHAMVVTNQKFTRSAQDLAKSNQVKLWGRHELANAVLSVQTAPAPQTQVTPIAAGRAAAPAHQSAGEALSPSARPVVGARPQAPPVPLCQRCSRPMVIKESARGKFWGCSGYPTCRNIVPIKN